MAFNNYRGCIFVIVLFICFYYVYYNQNIINLGNKQSMLDGCYHVYLDVGSNIGIQVRKLFEPERYPGAKVLPIYDTVFGSIYHRKKENHNNGKRICVVGFEPNPAHTKYLKEVEASYNKCGYKVKFLTETAVSGFNGKAMYYSDENFGKLEWGGGLLSPDLSVKSKKPKKGANNITVIRLSEFLKKTVSKRKLPINIFVHDPPKVLMKMDIEGSEIEVISDIIFTGALQHVNILMIEWHQNLEKLKKRKQTHDSLSSAIIALSKYSDLMRNETGHFNFKLMGPHDETYGTKIFPLPQC